MKNYYLLIGMILGLITTHIQGQNIRWEVSGQAMTTYNSIFEQGTPELTSYQSYGLRIGAAPNLSTDIQLAVRYQVRTDYGESTLLTETRNPRAAQTCPERRLAHESSGIETELLYRVRASQFSRIHPFFGGGLAFLFNSELNNYNQEIETVTFQTRNGQVRRIACGFPEELFEGSNFALIFAPGLRARITHKFHAELETQFRYFPLRGGNGLGSLGLNLVYNFY